MLQSCNCIVTADMGRAEYPFGGRTDVSCYEPHAQLEMEPSPRQQAPATVSRKDSSGELQLCVACRRTEHGRVLSRTLSGSRELQDLVLCCS